MMRRSLTGFAVALVCAWAVCGPDALAGSANSPPGSGDPPKGAAFKKDAQGTKLNGVISIELTEVFGFEAKSARGILRMRRATISARSLPRSRISTAATVCRGTTAFCSRTTSRSRRSRWPS